jgi:cyclic nucleotide gated channel
MVFIVRGKLESVSADGSKAQLHDGDVCGEELLTWYLEHSSVNRGMLPGCLLFFFRF